ncbi:MAG: hypothetical protein M5R36_04150 [Deltaproteobacteria bacterium]|nr:hypothetical protein [Deltaproteobacteria bacterium]
MGIAITTVAIRITTMTTIQTSPLAGRFTGGLSCYFPAPHIEVFVDASPGLWLIPETDFLIGAAIGVRYYF